MEQPFSTSKVTVEYFDPHDVYKLIAPGLVPRLPLRNLHWQSHAGPLRSIDTLHIELVSSTGEQPPSVMVTSPAASTASLHRTDSGPAPTQQTARRDDGFQTQAVGGRAAGVDAVDAPATNPTPSAAGTASNPRLSSHPPPTARRHQIPGLRRTPMLKVLLLRCDDSETYKSSTRTEVREWLKEHSPPAQSGSSKKAASAQENHDAFEWLIVHVVIPNTAAAGQPRVSKGGDGAGMSAADRASSGGSAASLTGGGGGGSSGTTSRWRGSSSTLLEKLRADFNTSGKGQPDRVAQIRVGINDVPYDVLPRVVPAVPSGYVEGEREGRAAWEDMMDKIKGLILASFDMRVGQYEEDIKEKDAQRSLPGWNFCTFFILKEGLARGFESMGLVDDALVGYDELSVGLDAVIHEQAMVAGSAEAHGGALLPYTDEFKSLALRAREQSADGEAEASVDDDDEETVDLQSTGVAGPRSGLRIATTATQSEAGSFDDIPVSATKKVYRELILANNVSVFDFRCYIFSRQVSLLLRLGNAWSTREELLAKVREQQESVLHGVAPRAPPPKPTEESENLLMLAEICRRTLEFIPAVSQVLRRDLLASMMEPSKGNGAGNEQPTLSRVDAEIIDNLVASFAFSVAQQMLAQTSTKALPIPPSTMGPPDGHEPKSAIPEPKTMMHPARSSSLSLRPGSRPPPSPSYFPGPGRDRRASLPDNDVTAAATVSHFIKAGLEELAARRAELYTLSRNILEEHGKKRGWSDGWDAVPVISESAVEDMDEVNLDDARPFRNGNGANSAKRSVTMAGVENKLLKTALDNEEDFCRLYETLTEKALRHYTVASHDHSVQANMADLGVLKYHVGDFSGAAAYFYRATPFFGERGWSLLELSMLIMYSMCLRELKRKEDYVKVLLKLLSKAATAEREKQRHVSSTHKGEQLDSLAMKGYLKMMLEAMASISTEFKHPLTNFVSDVDIVGYPIYTTGSDGFAVVIKVQSLLVENLPIEKARVHLVLTGGGVQQEMWLEARRPFALSPGSNKITLTSTVNASGTFEVDQMVMSGGSLVLQYERENGSHDLFKSRRLRLHRRSATLDVEVRASNHIQLDRNNFLELELTTGWNAVKACDIRVRSATGGLRLLSSEARLTTTEHEFAKAPESGLFRLERLQRNESVKVQFPFTVEQDVPTIALRVEVTYTVPNPVVSSDDDSPPSPTTIYSLTKTPSISISLPLGVNVQDVFRHASLLSRFTVSASSGPSPLRLFRSELRRCNNFSVHFGVPPGNAIVVFPKQPASLMYKITPRAVKEKRLSSSSSAPGGGNSTADKGRTMYLRLWYAVLMEEVRDAVARSLGTALKDTPLADLARVIIAAVLARLSTSSLAAAAGVSGGGAATLDQTRPLTSALTSKDLERCALLGHLETQALRKAVGADTAQNSSGTGVDWEAALAGIAPLSMSSTPDVPSGTMPAVAPLVRSFLSSWLLSLGAGLVIADASADEEKWSSMLIPVDVPTVAVVHTADIRLEPPLGGLEADEGVESHEGNEPVAVVNQLLSAVLRLRWSRVWDGPSTGGGSVGNGSTTAEGTAAARPAIEFSYEVSAPTDAWLLGGRRRGRFVVPAVDPVDSKTGSPSTLASSLDSELRVPLLLVPLREGYLPYPTVDIRETRPTPAQQPSNLSPVSPEGGGGGGLPSNFGPGPGPAQERRHRRGSHSRQRSPSPHRSHGHQRSSSPHRPPRHHSPQSQQLGGLGIGTAATIGPGGQMAGSGGGGVTTKPHRCETDYRNLGETVRVVADRKRVTLSLDASGPGGGPLVLESERAGLGGRVVI